MPKTPTEADYINVATETLTEARTQMLALLESVITTAAVTPLPDSVPERAAELLGLVRRLHLATQAASDLAAVLLKAQRAQDAAVGRTP